MLCCLIALLCACNTAPTGISVLTPPDSLTIVEGTAPDFTGGEITVRYKDGTTKTVPMTELAVSGLNVDLVGEQSAVLTYTEDGKSFSVPLSVKVVSRSVKRLVADDSAVNKDYIEGQAFSLAGLELTAEFNNGTEGDVLPSSCTVTPAKLTLDTTKVRITYHKAYVEIPVNVREKRMTGIRVDRLPAKTEYYVAEEFDTEGLAVVAVYDNGATESIPLSDLIYLHEDETEYSTPLSADDKVITIAYEQGGETYSTTLSLDEVHPLTVKSMVFAAAQTPVVCYVGLPFTFDGVGDVTITYVNDVLETVSPSAVRFAAEDILSTEQENVLIYLIGHEEVTLAVPVDARIDTVESLSLLAMPDKTEYDVGDTPDLEGIVLFARYTSGRTETVYAENVTTASTLAQDTTEILVRYGEASCAVPVTVFDTSVNLETIFIAESSTAKTTYAVGDHVDITGLVIYLHFSNGDYVEDYEPAADKVSVEMFVNGEYVESDVIQAGTTALLFTVRYTDDADRDFEGQVILEITLL